MKLLHIGSGVVIGALLASIGFLAYSKSLVPQEQVKVVTVTKVQKEVQFVDRERTKVVKEAKLFRAMKLDENGAVLNKWTITKCKFQVVGATLTDTSGNTFEVHGNIKVEPVK